MDGGAWWAAVHGVAKSWSDFTFTERLHFSLSCTGEGNGNPLQCSCLDNPRDRGAWWSAVYGVAQSWTRLKWLSSFSSKEQASFNFMAAVTNCSDFGAPQNKVYPCFHCFPIYLPWRDGIRCHDLYFLNVELLSQLFHSPLSPSSIVSLVPLCFLLW